jgi:hypothetical protein
MSRDSLLTGLQAMSQRIYEAEAFTTRLEGMLARAATRGAAPLYHGREELDSPPHSADRDCWTLVDRELREDPALARLRDVVERHRRARPEMEVWVRTIVFMFLQNRFTVAPAEVAAS